MANNDYGLAALYCAAALSARRAMDDTAEHFWFRAFLRHLSSTEGHSGGRPLCGVSWGSGDDSRDAPVRYEDTTCDRGAQIQPFNQFAVLHAYGVGTMTGDS